jgi:hypothetical protein
MKVYVDGIPTPIKAFIYDLMDEHTKVVEELEKLANLNLSLGDFSSYLNCSTLIIKKLDKYSKDWKPEDLAMYKSSIYENIANNIFEYDPAQIRDIIDKTLEDLQKTSNNKNYTDFCSRMIQGAVDNGEYMHALSLTHKILTVMNGGSIDPTAKDFNYEFLPQKMINISENESEKTVEDNREIGTEIKMDDIIKQYIFWKENCDEKDKKNTEIEPFELFNLDSEKLKVIKKRINELKKIVKDKKLNDPVLNKLFKELEDSYIEQRKELNNLIYNMEKIDNVSYGKNYCIVEYKK